MEKVSILSEMVVIMKETGNSIKYQESENSIRAMELLNTMGNGETMSLMAGEHSILMKIQVKIGKNMKGNSKMD